jgi:hypothetical protein
VLQRALAQESRSKDSKPKPDRFGVHTINYDSSDDEGKEVYAAEFVWPSKDNPSTCASLKPVRKNRHEEVKFTFDVSKCDRIFDELAKAGKLKFSHTIPPNDELKRRAYCKFHNTYSHATNDCNVFRRQIQSAIDQGRLMIGIMQIDENPFPVHTLELVNPKVLIRPHQAEKAKGKNVIIGKERPTSSKMPSEKTPRFKLKTQTLGGQDRSEDTGSAQTGLTGSRTGLTGWYGKIKDKARPSFEELLAKYKKKGAAQKQKKFQNKVKGVKPCQKQSMNKQESVEQLAKVVPARSVTIKQVWKPKQVVSSST